jgi:hypothetical protein
MAVALAVYAPEAVATVGIAAFVHEARGGE